MLARGWREFVFAVAHISGSFCVSRTAAMGMPKLEAGPQKSDSSESQHAFAFPCCMIS